MRTHECNFRPDRLTTTAALPALDHEEPVAVVRRVERPQINYTAVNQRVAESVAKDMRRFREQVIEENEDEFITILLLLGE